jgi:hypothetical protein
MIKLKNPWNDRPENASQSKVTRADGASLGSGPSPTPTTQPKLGSRYRRARQVPNGGGQNEAFDRVIGAADNWVRGRKH